MKIVSDNLEEAIKLIETPTHEMYLHIFDSFIMYHFSKNEIEVTKFVVKEPYLVIDFIINKKNYKAVGEKLLTYFEKTEEFEYCKSVFDILKN
jgi:hypothetical protein|tara:strand:- start:1485 stop:1763 length:279 start_codon:yes stop_codon:yes gene_type:complete